MGGNDAIFNKIAEALLVDYSSVYYVNAVTNEYRWYSMDSQYKSLKIEPDGDNFFENVIRDSELVVYKDDIELVRNFLAKVSYININCVFINKMILAPDFINDCRT